MTEAQTEDTPYIPSTVDDFAIEDEDTATDILDDEQTAETIVIKEIRKYLKEAEKEHNSFDIIDLTEQAKMTPTQQIAVHKCVVQHLRNIRNTINNKVKEN
jgi:hypothetical protein